MRAVPAWGQKWLARVFEVDGLGRSAPLTATFCREAGEKREGLSTMLARVDATYQHAQACTLLPSRANITVGFMLHARLWSSK